MSAVKFKLDNLVAIVDHNKYQQTGPTAEVLDLSPLVDKWAAFGWNAREINGHNLTEVLNAFEHARQTKGKPSAIIAHTEKGHGIKPILAELNDTNFHGKPLPKEAAAKALALIGE